MKKKFTDWLYQLWLKIKPDDWEQFLQALRVIFRFRYLSIVTFTYVLTEGYKTPVTKKHYVHAKLRIAITDEELIKQLFNLTAGKNQTIKIIKVQATPVGKVKVI